jgi:alpha-1,6-mannosyltransferase
MKTARVVSFLKEHRIASAGLVMLAALLALLPYPTLTGDGVAPFLVSFTIAGLAYGLVLLRLPHEQPRLQTIWIVAVLLRVVMLLTPVSLSNDVYRYIWDGHLLGQGVNPYAQPVDSPFLDAYHTPLREQVHFPYMATPYLPAAQAYFAAVDRIAAQSPFAFQAGAAFLDLAAGVFVLLALRRFGLPDRAVLVYLWNPLVVVEFAHGAHVDALMVLFLAAAIWGLGRASSRGLTLSVLAVAAGVLVKGWPLLMAPLFTRRWGWARTLLFMTLVVAPLAFFAAEAGWGLVGPADGRGVFGAVRIYSAEWEFNSGLYYWLARLVTPELARLLGLVVPALVGMALGLRQWFTPETGQDTLHLVRLAAFPFAVYLLLTHTIHPWYLALMLVLLPFFWPAPGENAAVSRWIWPWTYYMFFAAFTYVAYTGVDAPSGLPLIQTAAYLPFWLLLLWSMNAHVIFAKLIPPRRSWREIKIKR